MRIVLLTALMVGGATGLGTCIGYLFGHISHKTADIVLAFAAGIMLSASILGLILPAVNIGGITISFVGIFAGAGFISLLDKIIPHVHRMLGKDLAEHFREDTLDKVYLFVTAIAIHNLPEGLAAGISFGTGNIPEALLIAGGIAIQNIPEGVVTVTPMLAAGVNPRKALIYGLMTGIIEIFGTIIGYFAVTIAASILPFSLAFAGGTMLSVISDEMIPEIHNHGNQPAATYALLAGFCIMMVSDILLG